MFLLIFFRHFFVESLENRIAHFTKKRRIAIHYNDDDEDEDESMVRGKRQHGWANNSSTTTSDVGPSTNASSVADGVATTSLLADDGESF